MSTQNNALFLTVKKLYRILNQEQKTKFAWLILATFFSSVTDLLGLGFVIPIVGLALSESFYAQITGAIPFLSGFSKEGLLLLMVLVFFAAIILKNSFGLLINKWQVNFVRNLFVSSTENVLNKVFNRSLPEIQKESSNTWVNKLTQMQNMLASNIAISLIIVINEAIIFGLTAIIACFWDWHLFLLLIGILLPSVGLFYYKVKTMIKTAGYEKNQNYIALYGEAQEMIFGYSDIKIAGTEANFKKRFNEMARNYSRLNAKLEFTMFVPTRIIEVAIFICVVLILLYGAYVIKDINSIVTTITLFSVIAYRSIPSVNRFVMAMNMVNGAEFVLDDKDFMPEEKEYEQDEKTAEPLDFKEKIVFDQVSFQYLQSTKNVVNNCNLVIYKGEKIGIIGESGTGKSTLVNNFLGFLFPTKGKILIDDVPLGKNNLKNWWKTIGYVRQDAFILNTTLAENIALGESGEKIDPDRVHEAIKQASLSSLVQEWPEGIHTVMSERGNNLSGGQKQRIAIARAIYKGARVLVFDEATSALDSRTEEEITESINKLGKDLTIIMIAHRYSSLRFCDKIYKMEQGKITSAYSYQELISFPA